MQIELPDDVVDVLREALTPVIERLIDEKVEQRRPLLHSASKVADELSCSRASAYGLIRGGHLEAISVRQAYPVATATLHEYVEELARPTRPSCEGTVVSSHSVRGRTIESTMVGTGRGRSRQDTYLDSVSDHAAPCTTLNPRANVEAGHR